MNLNINTNNFTFVLTDTLENAFPSGLQQREFVATTDVGDDSSLAWLAAHLDELRTVYANSWILVSHNRVIAASNDPTELERRAAEEGIENPFITRIAKGLASMRLVLIEWLDSYGCSSDWQPLENHQPKPLRCRSVGWLFHDDDDCKVIVPHLSDKTNDHVPAQGCGDMTIPTRAILKITDLSSLSSTPINSD